MKLLNVDNLSVDFMVDGKWLPAVSNVSFDLEKGEILALVGESGCGKSVTCMSLARLLPEPPARYSSGNVYFESDGKERDVLLLPGKELRRIRGGKIAYIFQEPSVSLNPVFKVGEQIAEAIMLHRPDVADVEKEVVALLAQVGIPAPETRINSYPHEMSGGMQQRVMIAMALSCKPDLLIADEPTTALDVTIQAQILELLKSLRDETGMAVILVTHNLGIVSELADRVIVMYAGHTVEEASADKLIEAPCHPYTQALLSAVPKLGHSKEALATIPGIVPSPANFPPGCRFFGRCEFCGGLSDEEQRACAARTPEWSEINPGRFCRCWHWKVAKK
jgi:oligopeptide/dipeptide ABC transporter ATP-binding protein